MTAPEYFCLGFMGDLLEKYQTQVTISTDKRIRIMNEIIAGMRIIKMYAWEKAFAKLIESYRRYIKQKMALLHLWF